MKVQNLNSSIEEENLKIREELENRKKYLEENKQQFLSDELKKLNEKIARKQNIPPKNPNNITMRQLLIRIRDEVKNKPDEYYNKEISRINKTLEENGS
jgi:predicted metal-dependent hydrolase